VAVTVRTQRQPAKLADECRAVFVALGVAAASRRDVRGAIVADRGRVSPSSQRRRVVLRSLNHGFRWRKLSSGAT